MHKIYRRKKWSASVIFQKKLPRVNNQLLNGRKYWASIRPIWSQHFAVIYKRQKNEILAKMLIKRNL
jgi:hypothetical protein